MTTYKDDVVTDQCEILILGLTNEQQWSYGFKVKPSWGFPQNMSLPKSSPDAEALVKEVRATCLSPAEASIIEQRDGNVDNLPAVRKIAVLKRGKEKNNFKTGANNWEYFWDIGHIVKSSPVNVPFGAVETSASTSKPVTIAQDRQTQTDIIERRKDVRTALMQATELACSINQMPNQTPEGLLASRDVTDMADQFLAWLQGKLEVAPEPPSSPLVEHAKELGAVQTKEVPLLANTTALNAYLVEEQGMTVDQIKSLLGQMGYQSSQAYFEERGGETVENITKLAEVLVSQKDSNSASMPW